MFMCLISWERRQRSHPHKHFRGDFGAIKEIPNVPFGATKSLVYRVFFLAFKGGFQKFDVIFSLVFLVPPKHKSPSPRQSGTPSSSINSLGKSRTQSWLPPQLSSQQKQLLLALLSHKRNDVNQPYPDQSLWHKALVYVARLLSCMELSGWPRTTLGCSPPLDAREPLTRGIPQSRNS